MATSDIQNVKEQIESQQLVRRILGFFGLFVILGLTTLGMVYVEFTLAQFIKQFPIWLDSVSRFLQPDFIDLTLATRQE